MIAKRLDEPTRQKAVEHIERYRTARATWPVELAVRHIEVALACYDREERSRKRKPMHIKRDGLLRLANLFDDSLLSRDVEAALDGAFFQIGYDRQIKEGGKPMSLRMVLLALKDAAETASQRCKKPIGRSYDKHVLRVVDDIGRSWFAATGRMVTSSPSGPFDRLLQMLVTKLANDRSARKLIDSTLRRWRTERRESLERWARHKDPRVARIAKAELRRLR